MRRPPPQHRNSDYSAMTSMIDIVFLLLIFFVVTAGTGVKELLLPSPLAAIGGVKSDMAPPATDPQTIDVHLKLTISPESGRTIVDMNGTSYRDINELKEQLQLLAELGPENPIVLDVARNVPLGDLVDLYDTCQAAGFESINFAAKAVD